MERKGKWSEEERNNIIDSKEVVIETFSIKQVSQLH